MIWSPLGGFEFATKAGAKHELRFNKRAFAVCLSFYVYDIVNKTTDVNGCSAKLIEFVGSFRLRSLYFSTLFWNDD